MNILLKVAEASERLVWQKRLTDLKRRMPFELKVSHQTEGMMAWAERLVWVLTQEDLTEGIERLTQHCCQLKEQMGERGLLMLIVPHQLETLLSQDQRIHLLNACAQWGDEWLRETAYDEAALYQRLFKPRTQSQRLAAAIQASGGSGHLADHGGMAETQLLPSEGFGLPRGFSRLAGQVKRAWSGKGVKPFYNSQRSGLAAEHLRMKLCVCGQSALAYELGAALAQVSSRSVLLMDLDRFAPSADVYTGVKPLLSQPYEFFTKVSATGLNILLDCAKKGTVHREAFYKASQTAKGFPNLHILTGVYQLTDYEYYKAEDLAVLMDLAAGCYDVVLLKTNTYPYDGFTLMAMAKADYILTGIKPSLEDVRAHKQLTDLLWEKQNISQSRQGWVAFEDGPLDQVERRFLTSLNEAGFMGWVPVLDRRLRCERTGEGYLNQSRDRLAEIYRPLIGQISERLVKA